MIYLLTGWMSCCLTDFCYFSGPQNKGMDCALWPSLYYWTSMWESVLGDQLNRASKAPKAGVGECQGVDCFEIKPQFIVPNVCSHWCGLKTSQWCIPIFYVLPYHGGMQEMSSLSGAHGNLTSLTVCDHPDSLVTDDNGHTVLFFISNT